MLDRLFKLTAHGTTPAREVVAGITTFAAMSYILAVNPEFLSATGMDRAGLVTVTALAAAIGTLVMAGLTNYPLALAPGMGLNAYFAFTVCLGLGIPWQNALGLVFWNGVLFVLLSVTGVRSRVARAIPHSLRIGVQCGIGLFIAFIGLKNGGIIVASDATLVTIGDLSQPGPLLVILGIILTAALVVHRVPGAIILSILAVTMVGMLFPRGDGSEGNITALPDALVSLPSGISETFFALDILYPFTHFAEVYPIILTLLFVDLFDTIGTLIGVSRRANLLDEQGELPKIGGALTADASATIVGACLGTSTTTSYVESAAGVEAGGRTGLTGVTVAGCFLLALLFTPIILIIPPEATAPALVMVGVFMMQGIQHLNLEKITELAPAFVTMLVMPLAFSISEGIGIGFIAFTGVMVLTGRPREVGWLTYLLTGLFLLHYVLG
ncbi:MAG: NCS2 family permease [Opitutales bacterium]